MSTKQQTSNIFKEDEDYKKALYEILGKSQDDFEKQLSFISAGALGLSMIFIDKIVTDIAKAEYKCILIIGWVSLSFTLFINLVSHILSALKSRKTLKEYDVKNPDYRINADKRTGEMLIINWVTLVFLILGILAIIIFTSLNI